MSNKFFISTRKQIFLIYIPIGIEIVFHFFGEHLVGTFVKKYPENSEMIHNSVFIFHAFLWIIISYGIIHIIIEFIHYYGKVIAEEKQIVDRFQNFPVLVDEFREAMKYSFEDLNEAIKDFKSEIKEAYPTQHVGVVKKIIASNIWKFRGIIIGWNPNWSTEINTGHELNGPLLDIHLERLKSNKVKTIQYIFLDGYSVGKNNPAKFGLDNFYIFLSALNNRAKSQNGILNYIHKYKILVIPHNIWFNQNSDLGRDSMYYQNFIFIGGIRDNGKSSLILFINKKGFLHEDKHEYYIEIFKDNQIYDSLTTSFNEISEMAYKSGLFYRGIEYDSVKQQFKTTT